MIAGAIQAGLLDRALQSGLSAKAGRQIAFAHLRASLLTPSPTVVVDGLVVGSPPAITTVKLLTAPHAVLRFHWLAALTNGPSPFELTLTRPVAHLVRLGHGRNNYSLGPGGGAAGWRKFARLEATDGALEYDDPERRATLVGRFTYAPDPADPRPLHLTGGGVINGEAYTIEARGAALAAHDPAQPWPLDATIQDGALRASISGSSAKPFDFRQFDLKLEASGPNLADFVYLFEVPAPNTAPFRLSAQIKRRQPQLWMTGIAGQIGQSDLRGSLSSDHPEGGRRLIQADLQSTDLHLHDLRIVLTRHMTHAQTRVEPGALPPPAKDGGLVSASPFKMEEMRRLDLQLHIRADRMPDAPFPVHALDTVLALKSGRLSLSPTTFSTTPGQATASFVLDASQPTPQLSFTGRLRGARLAALKPGLAKQADGRLDLDANLTGAGASPRAAAARLHGKLALRLSDGRLQRAEAAALGADLIKAVGLKIGGKGDAQTGLGCAVADFTSQNGRLAARDLAVVTDAGWAQGSGDIDLGAQTVALAFQGYAEHPKPLQVDAPVQVTGPLAHPQVKVEAAKGVARIAGGLLGKPKIPAPACAALLARSAAFGAAH